MKVPRLHNNNNKRRHNRFPADESRITNNGSLVVSSIAFCWMWWSCSCIISNSYFILVWMHCFAYSGGLSSEALLFFYYYSHLTAWPGSETNVYDNRGCLLMKGVYNVSTILMGTNRTSLNLHSTAFSPRYGHFLTIHLLLLEPVSFE